MAAFSNFLAGVCIFVAVLNAEAFRDGNRRLKVCCARQKDADKNCKRKFCDFNALNTDNLGHFLSACSDDSTLMSFWDCASSRVDHTQCCKAKNVLPHCMVYCNARKLIPTDQRYLACFPSFNAIRDCFREHLDKHPNFFGDK